MQTLFVAQTLKVGWGLNGTGQERLTILGNNQEMSSKELNNQKILIQHAFIYSFQELKPCIESDKELDI